MARGSSNQRPDRPRGPIKNVIAILFIPIVISLTKTFYLELAGVKSLTGPARHFLWGFSAYAFMYIVLFKMDFLYVLGHEFMHVIAVWIFGGKVISFKVQKKKGSVTSTKKNIFIDLAPYLVPVYTVLVSLGYLIASSFWQLDSYLPHFIFFAGFSFSFHIIMTIEKVKIEQPDFLDFGYLNSLVLIYLINVIIMAFLFGFLFPDFVFGNFMDSFFTNTKELYIVIYEQLFHS